MNKRFLIPAAIALALGGGFTSLQTSGALAQASSTPAPGAQAPAAQAPRAHRNATSHVEGRIAYLKAELKITPAQEAQFDKVAQAMRTNAAERQKSFEAMRAQRDQNQTRSAVDRLESGVKLSQERMRAQERYLTAFKPLYDSLSTAQKQTADSLLAPHRGGHHRHRA